MPNERDHAMKELLLADIERDMGRERKLRDELTELQIRIRRDTLYFARRFGESPPAQHPATASPKGAGQRLRRRASGPSHAQLAAVALTDADKVSAPLKIAQIHRYLVRAGLGSMTHPTRQTLISSVMRSPLFQKVGRGLYALVRAIGREDLSMASGTGAAGAQAGKEETTPGKADRAMAFPQSVIDALWKRCGGLCECRRSGHKHTGRCNARLSHGKWHAHHVTSVAAGGADTLANAEALCVSCHERTRSFGG